MGKAILRIGLNVLEECLGWRNVATVEAILPPGMFELQRQCAIFLIESPEFAPIPPGMMLPEIYPMYEMTAEGPAFLGFQVLEERRELPESVVKIPPQKGDKPPKPFRIDESTLGLSHFPPGMFPPGGPSPDHPGDDENDPNDPDEDGDEQCPTQ